MPDKLLEQTVPFQGDFFENQAELLAALAREGQSPDALFIGCSGSRIDQGYINRLMRRLRERTGISPISCHVFRHSCATHLMDAGVLLPYIQLLLGHSDILTTQLYLRVSSMELKEKSLTAHPRYKWSL